MLASARPQEGRGPGAATPRHATKAPEEGFVPESPEDGDRLLTSKEAAALLRVHPNTLLRYSRQGRFPPAIRINARLYRWSLRAVRAHLARVGEPPAGQAAARPASNP